MKKSITLLAACVTLFMLGFADSAASAMAAESASTLRLGIAARPDSARVTMAEAIVQAVERETGGRVALELVVDSSPRGHVDIIQAVSTGQLDLALVDNQALAVRFADLQLLNQPFLFPNDTRAFRFYFGEGGAAVAARLEPSGIRILTWIPQVAPQVLSREPIGPNGFDGMAVGVDSPSPVLTAAVEAMGGTVVQFESPEEMSGAFASNSVAAVYGDMAVLAEVHTDGTAVLNILDAHFPFYAVCGNDNAMTAITGELKDSLAEALRQGIVDAVAEQRTADADARGRLAKAGVTLNGVDFGSMLDLTESLVTRMRDMSDDDLTERVDTANEPEIMF